MTEEIIENPHSRCYGPLREELRREGEWLFRWRSYLPLIPLALVLISIMTSYSRGDRPLDLAWELGCFLISLVGLGVRVLTIGHVPRHTSGRNVDAQVAGTVNTTGIYSVVRHPLYLGNFLMWLGAALFPRSVSIAVIVVLAFWLYYERIMFTEEDFLLKTFGEPYLRWARKTPAFIPRFSSWTPSPLPFCTRSVLRREFSGLFGIIATFAVLDLASNYATLGRWRLDPLWGAIFVAGVVVYLVILVIKKRGLLDVPGR